MSPESLPLAFGIMIPGMGVASILYGITCTQTFYYFRENGRNDPILIKGLTALLWLLNTLDLATVIHILYFYLISATANPSLASEVAWSLPLNSLMDGFTAFLVYSFYIWRLWSLSKNFILCIILALFSTTALVSTAAFTIRGIAIKMTLQQFYGPQNMTSVLVGILASSFATVTDFIIAFSLSWYLYKYRTGVKASESTANILIAYTIHTGFIASICGFCAFVTTVIAPHQNFGLLISLMLPPLQINGYLGSLNGRQFFRRWGETHTQSQLEAVTMSSLRIASHVPSFQSHLRPTTHDVKETHVEDPHLCKFPSIMHFETTRPSNLKST